MAAHQAPPSLGFSRQEHWSGLPFLSPMHKSEKWKWSHLVVSDFATPWTAAYQAPPSMEFSRQEYWSRVPLPSPGLPELPSKIFFLLTEAKAKFHKPLPISDSCSLSPDTSGDNSKDWITASCFLSKFHIVSLTSVASELHRVRTTDPLCGSKSSTRPSQLEEPKS